MKLSDMLRHSWYICLIFVGSCGGGNDNEIPSSVPMEQNTALHVKSAAKPNVTTFNYAGNLFNKSDCQAIVDPAGNLCVAGSVNAAVTFASDDRDGINPLSITLQSNGISLTVPGNAILKYYSCSLGRSGWVEGVSQARDCAIILTSPSEDYVIYTANGGGLIGVVDSFGHGDPTTNKPLQFGTVFSNPGTWAYRGQSPPPPAPPVLIDPIAMDSASTLLNGDHITPCLPESTLAECLSLTNYTPPRLSDLNRGQIVKGVAADGVAQVVIRIPATAIGERLIVSLKPGQCLNSDVQSCFDQYGIVFDPLSPPSELFKRPSTAKQSYTVEAINTTAGPMAFVAYRAPIDFARPSNLNDLISSARSATFTISSSSKISYADIDIAVIRPPTILLHGVNSSATVWHSFTPLVSKTGIFSITPIDYGWLLAPRHYVGHQLIYDFSSLGSIVPVPSSAQADMQIRQTIRQSNLGFVPNATYVLQKIQDLLGQGDSVESFRTGLNSKGISVAAVQVDVIGHSMGGAVTRTLPLIPKYYQSSTYGQGYVHKLITIGTPHLGSQQAIRILDANNTCIRENFFKLLSGSVDIKSINLLSGPIVGEVNGGTGDLRGNGLGRTLAISPASDAIKNLTDSIPLALIAGDMGTQVIGLSNSLPSIATRLGCGSTPLGSLFNTNQYSSIFDPYLETGLISPSPSTHYRSDAIVPLSSALNTSTGLSGVHDSYFTSGESFDQLETREGGKIFTNVVHGVGTLDLGFPGPYLLQEQTGIPEYAEKLLNTTIVDPIFQRGYRRFNLK